MKKVLLALGAALVFTSCTQKEEPSTLNGVYKMDSQSIRAVSNDSLLQTGENHNQLKIYGDAHYIWVNMAADSTANFGIGSYTKKGSDVVETNIYNSSGVDSVIHFNVVIETKETGYVQNISNMNYNGTDIKIEEVYSRMKEGAASDLDGLWKATANYFIKGTDTTYQNYPDYKMYNKGTFIWAIRPLMDTVNNKYISYIGTGSFTQDKDQIKEITSMSNISGGVPDQNLTLQNRKEDEFTQVINQPDGSVRYTVYKKVK
jgi:hypothetical protein